MARPASRLALAALIAPLFGGIAACGSPDTGPGPDGVTIGEARALDEAAEMIDQRRTPAEGPDEDGAGEAGTDATETSGSENDATE